MIFRKKLERVFVKGDEHILSVMESKEQQKQSLVKNERDVKLDRQKKDLFQKEQDLNQNISDYQKKLEKFELVYNVGSNWENPKTNPYLNKLIVDSDAIKNLKKEIITNENQKTEFSRKIDLLKAKIQKKKLYKKRIEDKILKKKKQYTKKQSSETIKSKFEIILIIKKNL